MDISYWAGIAGTGLSIGTFFLPDKLKSRRLTIIAFLIVILSLSCWVTYLHFSLNRIKQTSKAASTLKSMRQMEFDELGYVQACLAFLEQNKDVYPDAYKRATDLYERFKQKDTYFSSEKVSLSYEFDGILTGIAVLTQDK